MDSCWLTASVTPAEFDLALTGFAVLAGLVGSVLGLGGGIVIVPALTLVFGINIRLAIGASLVAVLATSSGAASAYVRERMTNLRVGMALEVATVTGALSGAFIGALISIRVLYVVFAVVLAISVAGMLRNRADVDRPVPPSRLADRLGLHSVYYDAANNETVAYRVTRVPVGAAMMYVAGAVSGLLGVGGGVFKVPAMDLAMRLPIKVSTSTSNLMIGVTAAASAGVYLSRGYVDPGLAMPVMLGVLAGSLFGTRILVKAETKSLRLVFSLVILVLGLQMLYKGLWGHI
jgi:hypothetical protein